MLSCVSCQRFSRYGHTEFHFLTLIFCHGWNRSKDYRSRGRGDAMLGYLERLALMNGCSSIFVLSKFQRRPTENERNGKVALTCCISRALRYRYTNDGMVSRTWFRFGTSWPASRSATGNLQLSTQQQDLLEKDRNWERSGRQRALVESIVD